MGILDEAIREHLELKRSRGAADDELERLEKEAFGPPTRPGEPDFPQAEAEHGEATAPEAEASPADGAVAAAEPAPGLEVPAEEEPFAEEPFAKLEPFAEEDLPQEHALAEPAPEPRAGEPPAFEELAEPGEGEVPDEAATELYDHTGDELGLGELELELEGEQENEAELEEPGATGLEPADGDEALEEPAAGEAAGDDDVLADTPEFLKDRPEDDELWFEQGEPKDFDFDDDD